MESEYFYKGKEIRNNVFLSLEDLKFFNAYHR
jgi:hypothetical protein